MVKSHYFLYISSKYFWKGVVIVYLQLIHQKDLDSEDRTAILAKSERVRKRGRGLEKNAKLAKTAKNGTSVVIFCSPLTTL